MVAVAISNLPGPTHIDNQNIRVSIVAVVWTVQILFDVMEVNDSYRQLLGRDMELDGFWRRSSQFRREHPHLRTELEDSRLEAKPLIDSQLEHILISRVSSRVPTDANYP